MTLNSPAANKVVALVGEAIRLLDSIGPDPKASNSNAIIISSPNQRFEGYSSAEDARAYLRSALQGLGRRLHQHQPLHHGGPAHHQHREAFQDLIQRSDVALQQSARWRRELAMQHKKKKKKKRTQFMYT